MRTLSRLSLSSRHLVTAAVVSLALGGASRADAATTVIDFSDQTASFVTPVANPLVYPDVAFSSANGLRVFTFTGGKPLDRGLCPHANNACRSSVQLDFTTAANGLTFDLYQVDDADSVLSYQAFTSNGAVNGSIALTRGFNINAIDLSALVGVTRLILDGTSDEEGVIYDNFRFTAASAPVQGGVPEPSAWALMILGFGALGAALRRQTGVAGRGGAKPA